MVACLAPWQPLSSGHAFMDNRAIVSTSPGALATDIADTQSFDRRVGFVENIGKRQHWSDQDVVPRRIEHLGVLATPTDSSFGIIPRQGWAKLETSIAVLASIPGSNQVRLKLAFAYIRPLWLWASPLVIPPPIKYARTLARAVWHTGCTW
ncbi:unnamed protein product [Prorocentrum cordatum]|uniref:Uncharacterized protein n=1 Tax=Prorocentrum cordatum TaxID=2364126 RepID=A0ABN9PB35_9DINO|nr:unnamed protein product [Polarella glacialis]